MSIHDNYIYSLSCSKWSGGWATAGIYLDNGSCFKTVTSNVLDKVPMAFTVWNPPNHDNTFQQNYHNCPLGKIKDGNTAQDNTPVTGSSWPEAAVKIMKKAGPRGQYRRPEASGGAVGTGR